MIFAENARKMISLAKMEKQGYSVQVVRFQKIELQHNNERKDNNERKRKMDKMM